MLVAAFNTTMRPGSNVTVLHCQPLRLAVQAQLSGLSQVPCSLDRKPSVDQIRATAAFQTASLSETKAARSPRRHSLQMNLSHIGRLEQLSAAASIRELDAKKAIAVLCGTHMRYFVKSTAIDLGRSTSTLGKVMLLLSHGLQANNMLWF